MIDEREPSDIQIRMLAMDQATRLGCSHFSQAISAAEAIYNFIVGPEVKEIAPHG